MIITLILNTMIVLAVCFVSFSEHNPLALLALTFLMPLPDGGMPRFLSLPGMSSEEDESKPIGFTADIA